MKNSKRMSRGYLLRAAVEGSTIAGRRPRHTTRLFGAQCIYRVHGRGTTGWRIAGCECACCQSNRYRGQRKRVPGLCTEQQVANQHGGGERSRQSRNDSESDEPSCFPHDQLIHRPALCAKRHPDADLAGTPGSPNTQLRHRAPPRSAIGRGRRSFRPARWRRDAGTRAASRGCAAPWSRH
jgi:hypothetical protein